MTPTSTPLSILCLPGSTREGSYNRHLLGFCAAQLRELGAEPHIFELRDHPIPLYDGDEEKEDGPPENAVKLSDALRAADGLLIVTPEYNAGVPGVLKNAIDYVSRVRDAEGETAFDGLPVGLASASPGRLGGIRSLGHLRPILVQLGCIVSPLQACIGGAHEVLDQDGRPTVDALAALLDESLRSLLRLAGALKD